MSVTSPQCQVSQVNSLGQPATAYFSASIQGPLFLLLCVSGSREGGPRTVRKSQLVYAQKNLSVSARKASGKDKMGRKMGHIIPTQQDSTRVIFMKIYKC